jgi:hypothetical protein
MFFLGKTLEDYNVWEVSRARFCPFLSEIDGIVGAEIWVGRDDFLACEAFGW